MAVDREAIVREAARVLQAGARIDTGALARQLGISRATLFRRVGSREALLAEALWLLAGSTLRALERDYDTARAAQADGLARRLRTLAITERFREQVAGSTAVHSLLADEPALALRLLTDPRGRVQPRLVAAHVQLLERDLAERRLVSRVPVPTLCFALVRLGESFLYADVLASRDVDLEAATTVLDALVTSVLEEARGEE